MTHGQTIRHILPAAAPCSRPPHLSEASRLCQPSMGVRCLGLSRDKHPSNRCLPLTVPYARFLAGSPSHHTCFTRAQFHLPCLPHICMSRDSNRHPNHIHNFSQRVSIHGSRGQRNVRDHRRLTNLIILLSSPSHMHPRNTYRSARGITSDVAMRIRSNAILAYGIIAVQLSARWRRPSFPHPDRSTASLTRSTVTPWHSFT